MELEEVDGNVQVSGNTGVRGKDLGRMFDHFWSLAVRKVKKGTARTAFAVAVRRADLLTVIGPAWRQANEAWTTWPDQTKVPHPSSWLRAESWDDDPVTPHRAPEGKIERGAKIAAAMAQSDMTDREKLDAILAMPAGVRSAAQPKEISR